MKNCIAQNMDNWDESIVSLSDVNANRQIKNAIISAAEQWNLESRGAVLVYAGTINAENADAACSSYGIKKPAIFINFHTGCFENPSCDTGTLARATTGNLNSCDNTAEIIFYGDKNTADACSGDGDDDSATGIYAMKIDGSDNDRNFKNVMVHEFGHILGLGHQTTNAVMRNNALLNIANDHLFYKDMECVDDTKNLSHRQKRRIIEYRYQGFSSNGNEYSSVVNHSNDITKGFLSGNYLRDDMDNYLGLLMDNYVSTDLIQTSGIVSLTNQNTFGISDIIDPYYLYINPVFMTPVEKTGVNQDHRITYNDTLDLNSGFYFYYDLPEIRYVRSSDYFYSSYSGPHFYQECIGSNCSSSTNISSHIPMVSSWDNFSENTIFVAVKTERNYANHGQIDIYPGYYGGSNSSLRTPSRLSSNRSAPSDSYSDFSYTLRTDVAPAVACAPTRTSFAFNCLLAWVDRGIMDGRILYTYFRVDNNAIVWSNTHDVYVRGNTETFSHISAAYFDGAFWLAWKSIDGDVKYCSTTDETTWASGIISKSRNKVVDPPTWTYVPEDTKESVLLWTEFDTE